MKRFKGAAMRKWVTHSYLQVSVVKVVMMQVLQSTDKLPEQIPGHCLNNTRVRPAESDLFHILNEAGVTAYLAIGSEKDFTRRPSALRDIVSSTHKGML